jgi:hypothetical protein
MSKPEHSLDPEGEQEVDFGRYVRLVAARWWLVVAGLIVGAVVGYAVSLGGTQRYQATATLYLGQPYSASGNVQLQAAQNPSTPKDRSCDEHRNSVPPVKTKVTFRRSRRKRSATSKNGQTFVSPASRRQAQGGRSAEPLARRDREDVAFANRNRNFHARSATTRSRFVINQALGAASTTSLLDSPGTAHASQHEPAKPRRRRRTPKIRRTARTHHRTSRVTRRRSADRSDPRTAAPVGRVAAASSGAARVSDAGGQ